MHTLKNKIHRQVPVALPGRTVLLSAYGDTAVVTDLEFAEGPVKGRLKLRQISSTPGGEEPGLTEAPNAAFQDVLRRRKVAAEAAKRAKSQ